MMKVPNDRRALRTKKLIRNALSELIDEKGFNNISITDITARADINRGTFYLHYNDKYDLLEKVENEVIQEIQKHTENLECINFLSLDCINEPIPFIIKLFEYFKENTSLMKAILGPKGDPLFHRKLKRFIEINLFEKKKIQVFKKENMLIPEEYFIAYLLSAHLGVVLQWLESDMEKSPEEMALILSKMSLLGPLRVAGVTNSKPL